MARKVLLRSLAIRHKSSLKDEDEIDAPRERRQFSEVAGGSAAECTAICCCGPWAVLNLIIFAVYRMPAGLCRKAINKRKRRRKMKKKYLIQQRRPASQDFLDGSVGVAMEDFGLEVHKKANDVADGEDLLNLEEEMWGRFNQTGFWRSSSQRHE